MKADKSKGKPKKNRQQPIEVTVPGKTGRVKIYRVKNASTSTGFAFQVADFSTGRRKLLTFADEAEARAKAKAIISQHSSGDLDAITLTNRDKSDYQHALEHLKPSGVALPIAALHFAEAVKILGSDLVVEAARFYAKRHAGRATTKTVRQVYELLLADAAARKLSDRYIEDLRYRVGAFADAFDGATTLASITGDEVRDFLAELRTKERGKSLPISPRSYNNFLGAIRRFYEFAKGRKFLPADHDELAGIDPVKDNGGEIEIYTPDEISRLLVAASDNDMLPAFAIGAFAGLRSAEIERLDWSEVNLAEAYIEVKAGKAKTASRRIVPIVANLAKWLETCAEKSGPVWPHGHAYFYERQRDTTAATGSETVKPVAWKHNGLRHSFISYRLAEIQNVNQVALEAGNSPTMIFQHYRELVTKKQAGLWFNIVPTGDEMPKVNVAA